jgi:putative MFS transporter
VSRIAAGVGPLVFVAWLVPAMGLVWSFVVTGVLVVAAVALMMAMAPETKGRELEVTEASPHAH